MRDKISGTTIAGRYRIVDTLGQGGLGTVYKALDMRVSRIVALKVLPSELVSNRELDNLIKEFTVLASLSHPNIVKAYDCAKAGDWVYIALEYVEGRSLAQILAEGKPLDLDAAIGIVRQVGTALEYAHQKKFIHRDVKPANILISEDGRVLLSDFGLAQPLGESGLTEIGTICGTVAYMSPEQATGKLLDARSDVFSLGVVLYQSLTGRQPFTGELTGGILKNLVESDPPPPSAFNALVDPSLQDIVLKALAKDPERRFSSMQLFVEALGLFAARWAPALSGFTRVSQRVLQAEVKQSYPRSTRPARIRSRIRVVAIVCTVALALFVPALFVQLSRQLSPAFGKDSRVPGGNDPLLLALFAVLVLGALLLLTYRFVMARLRRDDVMVSDGPLVREGRAGRQTHEIRPDAHTGSAAPSVELLDRIMGEGTLGRSSTSDVDSATGPVSEFLAASPTTETTPHATLPLSQAQLQLTEPSAMAWLLVLNGELRGRQFRLTDTFTIGRSSEQELSLIADSSISRQHARIALENGRFYIYDLGSKNATKVNGQPLQGPKELRDRDEIRIGAHAMLFISAVSQADLTLEAKRRLQDFDTLWDGLVRSVRHD